MKTRTIILVLLSTAIIFTSCCKMEDYVTPSAEVTEQERTFSDFSELDVSDAFKVYVTFSEGEESVRIEANKNLHSHIQVSKYNNRLTIKLDDNLNIRDGEATLNVYITMQQLTEVFAAGAAQVKFQNQLTGNNFKLQLTGASSLNGQMQVNKFHSILVGGSNMNISGIADSFDFEGTGASNMEGFDFETNKFTADLEGACNASLTVQESLVVKAEGASNIYYKGNGTITSQNLSGASQIHKMD